MENKTNVVFQGKIVPVKPLNSKLTLAKCYVMAIGVNKHRSDITREAAEDAIPTLFNIPVVGHLYLGEDGNYHMGGHDKLLVKDENGKYKFKVLTVPFGVVPQQDNVHFEEVEEADSTKRIYQVADVILWTGHYPELLEAAYDDETLFNQSMEVDFLETSKNKDGTTKVSKYQYSKLCLLGKSDEPEYNVKPCFPSARVDAYTFSETGEEWEHLFGEFKIQLAELFESQENNKGGKSVLSSEKITEVLAEFSIESTESLSFEIGEMSEEELRAKLNEEFAASGDTANGEGEGTSASVTEGDPQEEESTSAEPEKFALDLTYNQKLEALRVACNKLCIWDKDSYKDYTLCDCTDEYVYITYRIESNNQKENGHIRCSYTVEGEAATINMQSAQPVKLIWATPEDEAAIEAKNAELESLRAFKVEKFEEERRKEYGEVISKFSDLAEIEDYKSVVGCAMEFASKDELEKELFAIRGRYGIVAPAGKKPVSEVRVPVTFSEDGTDSLAEKERQFMKKYAPGQAKN